MSTSHGTPIPGSPRRSAGRTGSISPSGRSPGRGGALPSGRELLVLAAGLAALLALILGIGLAGCGGSSAQVHRSSIVAVKSEPWNQALSRHAQNTIVADPDLAFAVTVANPGVVAEKDVAVTLTVDRQPAPIVLTRTVDRLEGGEAKTLVFRKPGWGQLSALTTLIVETLPPKGVRTLAAYPVAFGAYRPPTAAATGLHGTGLIGVRALPGNQALSPAHLNAIVAQSRPGFAVRVKDTGESTETGVKVTLTILQSPPIVATRTIPIIERGRERTVVFRNLGGVRYSTTSTLRVDVQPVPGEKNRENNAASYPVTFSLG